MAESIWVDRFRRLLLMARAPWYFLTAQSYRQALVKGMLRGEVVVKSGVRKLIRGPTQRDRTLRLILSKATPAVDLIVSTVAFDLNPSAEGRLACSMIEVLAKLGLDIRLIAIEESPFAHEARLRAWLQQEGVIAPPSQVRLEVLDGTEPFVPVSADDIFIVLGGGAHAALLRERFTDRMARGEVHVVVDDASAEVPEGFRRLALSLSASRPELRSALTDIAARLPRPPSRFADHSRLGIGYTVVKPLPETHSPARTCLFVHFDPNGRIDPHVLHYLAALKACGLDIVLITSGELKPEAVAEADPLSVAILARENKGLDFAGWALAMELFPSLLQSQSLLIANDSVYGPVGDLEALFRRMEAASLDVWGPVESRDITRHFQSWFVNFRRPALQSDAFSTFWSGVLPLDDKRAVIHQYEVPIWRVFEAAGLRVGAVVAWDKHGFADNPAMHGWRALLHLGLPFVKVQLLRDNPTASVIDGWAGVLRERGYPAGLVVNHLYRVKGPDAAAFREE
jgi:hypothetical protein